MGSTAGQLSGREKPPPGPRLKGSFHTTPTPNTRLEPPPPLLPSGGGVGVGGFVHRGGAHTVVAPLKPSITRCKRSQTEEGGRFIQAAAAAAAQERLGGRGHLCWVVVMSSPRAALVPRV